MYQHITLFLCFLFAFATPVHCWGHHPLLDVDPSEDLCDSLFSISNTSNLLSSGLYFGQSFTASDYGEVQSVSLYVCQSVDAQLAIRLEGTDNDEGWNSGTVLGYSDIAEAESENTNLCHTSIYGSQGYALHTFTFDEVYIESGKTYVIELISGTSLVTQTSDYSGGVPFRASGEQTYSDLYFELEACPVAANIFGCTDTSACNYSSTAIADNGTCLTLDCTGTCGGVAYNVEGCGCVDGTTGMTEEDCYGCLDPLSCTFDPLAQIEDGSCLYQDCNLECGGTAVDSDCGCVGGSTGINSLQCYGQCITDLLETSEGTCGGGLMTGQTFLAETNALLLGVQLRSCVASNTQIAIRKSPTECGEEWNSGELLAVSEMIVASESDLSNCITSIGGDDKYVWRDFEFEDVPLLAGNSYVIEVLEGYAIRACNADYDNGYGFQSDEAAESKDMVFKAFLCPDDFVAGCTDATACNYNVMATVDDSTCLFEDCTGTCGGTASEQGTCGCIGGTSGLSNSRCVDGTVLPALENDGDVCSNTLVGQQFIAPEDGFLNRWAFHVDPSASQSFELIRVDGALAEEVVASFSREASNEDCLETSAWIDFDLPETALEGGKTYQINLTDGEAFATCDANYTEGAGVAWFGLNQNRDLAFRMVYRIGETGELQWGCSEPSACNYDPDVTHDDGSCLESDCNGECGGSAYVLDGCGCIGGNTGLTEESCYGCTDPVACNYDATVSIDDGSCASIDCNGDCGGTAVVHDVCGCIGGNTGQHEDNCSARCQGVTAINTYPYDGYSDIISSQSGQTFTSPESGFLGFTKIRTLYEPPGTVTIRLRLMNGSNPHNGTLLASSSATDWVESESDGGDLMFEWSSPYFIEAGTSYALNFSGGVFIMVGDNLHDGGGAVDDPGDSPMSGDIYFEISLCDALFGCMEENACNYDSEATETNNDCQYPEPGLNCDGNSNCIDEDSDGICASVDADDSNPYICMDTDNDGCDDCSVMGVPDPQHDGDDVDGDGICDEGDLCSDLEATNYADPDNLPCRGECDTAPTFVGISVSEPASNLGASDGNVRIDFIEADLLYVNDSLTEVTQLILLGINGAPDFDFDLTEDTIAIPPGRYSATILNREGCEGVAPSETTSGFGQDPISHTLFMTYSLCCNGGCDVYDVDTDGICDDEDLCIDKLASNYADPNNTECAYE